MRKIIKTIAISTFASSILLGTQLPSIGDINRNIETPNIKTQKPLLPKIEAKEYKVPMLDTGKKVYIKDFQIIGNQYIPSSDLEKFFVQFKDKELTFTQLQDISGNITKYYREQGYFVARAYIPEQNIYENNGVLEIAIIEGNYGEFHLKNSSLVKDRVLQGMLDYAKRDDVVSTRTLEQSMLIINDTPGAVVTEAIVLPGSKVGTSDFEIKTQATPRYDGYIILDNQGSRYTGKNRLLAGINFNSPSGIGDKLSLNGLLSNDSNLKNGGISYSLPLMSNGLRGELSYSQTNYSLVEEYASLQALGVAKTLETRFSYPITRTRIENLYANLSLITKDLKDEVGSVNYINKKDTKSLQIGLDYDKSYFTYGKKTNSKVSLNYTYGRLQFDNLVNELNDKNGANTTGNYSKINVELGNNIELNQNINWESSLRMQYALNNKNLDGSEDFSVGGAYGVRVYPDGELSAENGYIFSSELKYKLPTYSAFDSSIGVFYDVGRAYMANNKVNFESKTLQDIGIGYYVFYNDFFGKVQFAWTLNSQEVTSEPSKNSRILFQSGWIF
ncbi:MAG: ShlB/FhaC/HecB family hemolysin secretion/activation protein [Campylobacterota bacterium]